MEFWRNANDDFDRARKEAESDLMEVILRPPGLEILKKVLEYLHAVRTEDRMILSGEKSDKTDAGMKLAIDRLKRCGQTAYSKIHEG